MKNVGISEMGYKRLLEMVLGCRLTREQVACIIKDWKAFAEDPCKYIDTVVIDMIHLYLEE